MTFDPFQDFFGAFTFMTIIFIVIAVIAIVFFVVIIYFIIRSLKGDTKRSERMSPAKPYPEKVFKKEETSIFCKYCGAKITEYLSICPDCGERLN